MPSNFSYGAANSTIAPRYYNAFDGALSLRDYTATAAAADTNTTAITFYGELYDEYKFYLQHAAITGTIDGSNKWVVSIEADVAGGDFSSPVTLVAATTLTAAATTYVFPLTGERARSLRLAASKTTELTQVRAKLDITGTVGALTIGVWISPDC